MPPANHSSGLKQGVLEVCPDCQVLVSYLAFGFPPHLGKEAALAQYDQAWTSSSDSRAWRGVIQPPPDSSSYRSTRTRTSSSRGP
jgi:hypothetical protein